jgi:hypothetical protein
MVYIYKNTTNRCVFTLNEKTTYQNADYFISLYSKQNNDNELLWLKSSADTSNNTSRYNEWLIDETTITDVDNLEINLQVGQYDYTVYQTTGSTLSLSAVTTSDVVETGRCNVRISDTYDVPTLDNTITEITFE